MRISDWSSDVCSSDLRARDRQLLETHMAQVQVQLPRDRPPAQHRALAEMRVEIAQHGADVGRAGEILKHVEPVRRLARGGKPADRRARDRAAVDAMTVKRPEHADMRPARSEEPTSE